MSSDGQPRAPRDRAVDLLEDEAPPEIPDIFSEDRLAAEAPPLQGLELDPDPVNPNSMRRLSPPPKPRRRERSITAPQTPSSRSTPPALNDDALSLALKAPPIPSLIPEGDAAASREPAPDYGEILPVAPQRNDKAPLETPVYGEHRPLAPIGPRLFDDPEPEGRWRENGAHQPRSAEAAPERAPDPPSVDASPVLAMRIINVGEASRVEPKPAPIEAPPTSLATPADEAAPLEPLTLDVPIFVSNDEFPADEAAPPPVASVDAAEELADDDVAPDSEDRPPLPLVAAIAPIVREAAPDGSVPQKAQPPPPPPKRRPLPSSPEAAPQSIRPAIPELDSKPREEPPPAARPKTREETPSSKASDETARIKAQRRAWWEELFSEDFVRALSKLSDEQVGREVDFIEESLGVAAGGVVLDLGCGAGHHAVELASRGYGVVGYDLSLSQLALAADVAQERGQRINFLQGDMREMAFEEMFDGIFCWNTTFGYFEEEKNIAVAQRVFKALRPGGMFLLDVVNRDFVAQHQPSQVWYEGDSCVCMDDMSLDFITSRLRVKRSIILDDGRTRESVYSVRLYALHELGKILHDVGFRITEASGHPAMPGVFFGQCSPRIIILAQRP
ncbi:MAG TPA: methyltransferase domain-containing protein [Polyangiaceae bacterium]